MEINLAVRVPLLPTPCHSPLPISSLWIRSVFQGPAGPAVRVAELSGADDWVLTWALTLNDKGIFMGAAEVMEKLTRVEWSVHVGQRGPSTLAS